MDEDDDLTLAMNPEADPHRTEMCRALKGDPWDTESEDEATNLGADNESGVPPSTRSQSPSRLLQVPSRDETSSSASSSKSKRR